jgi:flavin reductase (DIM6/NTAB) family NADH-FMN oxidoreductase RutF
MFSHSQHVEGRMKDTPRNVLDTGEFVHNVVSESVAEQMHRTSSELPPGKSEFDAFNIERAESSRVSPPRVADAPVAFECTLRRTIDLGSHSMVLGDVEYVHLAARVTDGGELDLEAFDTMGRLSAGQYSPTSPRVEQDALMGNVFLDGPED